MRRFTLRVLHQMCLVLVIVSFFHALTKILVSFNIQCILIVHSFKSEVPGNIILFTCWCILLIFSISIIKLGTYIL